MNKDKYVIKENGYYVAILSGNNPDTRQPYVGSIILIFKGIQCIQFQIDESVEPTAISDDIFKEFDTDSTSEIMQYEVHDDVFEMRSYRSESKDEWDQWNGKIVEDGLILTMNSHYINRFYLKMMDDIIYTDTHFKFYPKNA